MVESFPVIYKGKVQGHWYTPAQIQLRETSPEVVYIQNVSLKPACVVKDYLDSRLLESKSTGIREVSRGQ